MKSKEHASIKTISLVSTLPYMGNVGSGSVSGYYTIWTARINAYGEIKGQPHPRKINQNLSDLSKFRGKLYELGDENKPVQVMAIECSDCGELSLITEGSERCNICIDKDLWGLKEESND